MNKPIPSDEEILQRFAKIVAKNLSIDESKITFAEHLDTLGADSLDLLVIVLDTEEEFKISLPEKSIIKMADQVFGAGVLIQDGELTETGRKFLLARMPELVEQGLGERVTVAQVNHILAGVRTWVRMIRTLMEHSPRECPECGAEFEKAEVGHLKCSACGAECEIPSGEELNMGWIKQYYEREYAGSGS